MEETGKISLTCGKCGKQFKCKAPLAPGNYSVVCINPDCQSKISFRYPANVQEQPPKPEPKYGLLEDGNYRFRCGNEACRMNVLVPAKAVKVGKNTVICPKCQTPHQFKIEPTEEDLLKCRTADCKGALKNPGRGDGVYSASCELCGQEYSMIVHEGKVVKVTMKTPPPPTPIKQDLMKLVVGHLIGKREYSLSKGSHWIGRQDNENSCDFPIKDKYASARSVRIDVNENGGNLVYKMTVERASNPVYHNSRELTVGDVVYLNYGDTLKLGKTLIKIQKRAK